MKRIAGRRGWALVGCLMTAAACARVEPPPGGPEDKAPPQVIAVRPDTAAIVGPGTRPVVIVFDERISEKGFEDADPRSVMVSPRTSPVRVERSRDELRVELRRGWEPNRIYHVTVLPVVQDLFNNRIPEPVRVVFSTGPPIPATMLDSKVTDRITGKQLVGARVEAILAEDSLVYALLTDSAGRADFRRIPVGGYRVRAFQDLNNNRALDPFEPRDTARIGVAPGDSAKLRLSIVLPDSTPPRAASAELANSVLQVKFDDYLDPEQTVSPEQIEVLGPGSAAVVVQRASVGPLPAVRDTTPAPRDTLVRPETAAGDTATRPAPLPNRSLYVQLRGDLLPDTVYQVRVRNVRNIVGLVGDSETEFRTARAPATPAAPATLPAETPIIPAPDPNPGPAPTPRPGTPNPSREPS